MGWVGWGTITVCNPGTIEAGKYLDRGEKGEYVDFDTFLYVALIPYNGPGRKWGWGVRYPTMDRPETAKGPVYPNRGVSTHTQTDGAGLIYRLAESAALTRRAIRLSFRLSPLLDCVTRTAQRHGIRKLILGSCNLVPLVFYIYKCKQICTLHSSEGSSMGILKKGLAQIFI